MHLWRGQRQWKKPLAQHSLPASLVIQVLPLPTATLKAQVTGFRSVWLCSQPLFPCKAPLLTPLQETQCKGLTPQEQRSELRVLTHQTNCTPCLPPALQKRSSGALPQKLLLDARSSSPTLSISKSMPTSFLGLQSNSQSQEDRTYTLAWSSQFLGDTKHTWWWLISMCSRRAHLSRKFCGEEAFLEMK